MDFYNISNYLQNCNGQFMGADATEDHWFHAFFGCGAKIAFSAWNLLIEYILLSEEAAIVHLLWALFFMKVYPTEEPTCDTAGGHGGAIDPKTLCKYIWPIIEGFANLESFVVSFDFFCILFCHNTHSNCCSVD